MDAMTCNRCVLHAAPLSAQRCKCTMPAMTGSECPEFLLDKRNAGSLTKSGALQWNNTLFRQLFGPLPRTNSWQCTCRMGR